MKEYCILNCKKKPIFALSFCEGANNLMPKTPMGRIDGGDNLCYSHD